MLGHWCCNTVHHPNPISCMYSSKVKALGKRKKHIWLPKSFFFHPQMRQMYGLFTYMNGEEWPHEPGEIPTLHGACVFHMSLRSEIPVSRCGSQVGWDDAIGSFSSDPMHLKMALTPRVGRCRSQFACCFFLVKPFFFSARKSSRGFARNTREGMDSPKQNMLQLYSRLHLSDQNPPVTFHKKIGLLIGIPKNGLWNNPSVSGKYFIPSCKPTNRVKNDHETLCGSFHWVLKLCTPRIANASKVDEAKLENEPREISIKIWTFQGVPISGELTPFRNHLAPFGRSR